MKYMHSEWRGRVDHWIDTLKKDLYHPLGEIRAEAFFTMEHLTPEQAAQQAFASIEPGTPWGNTWEYCWLRGQITLPPEAEGRRIVMDLCTGGETTVFVDGKSFGTYRAGWVDVPHHFIVDNCLTASGEAGRSYDLLLEAYAGHFFPQSWTMHGCCTGPVLPGSYTDPKEGKLRTSLGRMTYGVWNEDAYQLYLDMETLNQLMDQVDPESLRADVVGTESAVDAVVDTGIAGVDGGEEHQTFAVDFLFAVVCRIEDFLYASFVFDAKQLGHVVQVEPFEFAGFVEYIVQLRLGGSVVVQQTVQFVAVDKVLISHCVDILRINNYKIGWFFNKR